MCPGQAKFEGYLPNRQDGIQIFFEPWHCAVVNELAAASLRFRSICDKDFPVDKVLTYQ